MIVYLVSKEIWNARRHELSKSTKQGHNKTSMRGNGGKCEKQRDIHL